MIPAAVGMGLGGGDTQVSRRVMRDSFPSVIEECSTVGISSIPA